MSIVLFDLRNATTGYVDQVNARLSKSLPDYVERYGDVCSARWWLLYEDGRISSTVLAVVVTHLGVSNGCFGEEHDIIRILTDRCEVAYDREGFWCDPRVQLGVWVIVPTPHGDNTSSIDVRISLLG